MCALSLSALVHAWAPLCAFPPQPTPGHPSHVSPALLTSWHPGLWIPTSSLQTSSPPWDPQPSEFQSHSPGLPMAFMGSDPHCLSRPKTLSTISYTRGNWLGGEIACPRHCPPPAGIRVRVLAFPPLAPPPPFQSLQKQTPGHHTENSIGTPGLAVIAPLGREPGSLFQ